MAMTFIEMFVTFAVFTYVAFSAYGQNVVTVFKQKGITTRCSKNAMKNVTIFDADSGITYIGLDEQPMGGNMHKCTLYPPGEKHNAITIDIDFGLVRGNAIEAYRTGRLTLTMVRRENLSTVFAADNSLFDVAPEVLYDKLARLEANEIRLKTKITELEAMRHQDVQKIVDTTKALKMAETQGRFPK